MPMPDQRSWTVRRPAQPGPSLPLRLFSYACLVFTTAVVGAIGATFINYIDRFDPDSTWSERQYAQRAIDADSYDLAEGRAVLGGIAGAIAGVVFVVQPSPGRKRAA